MIYQLSLVKLANQDSRHRHSIHSPQYQFPPLFFALGFSENHLNNNVQNLIQLMEVTEKPIEWRGSSLKDIKDEKIFSLDARKEAGHQLSQVQIGLDPDDWRPFEEIGSGTKEIRINLDDGWYRVMYVAKFQDAVYVLHCFKKKTRVTSRQDKEIAISRYKEVIAERIRK